MNQDSNGTPKIKVLQRTTIQKVVEIDEIRLDEIRITNLGYASEVFPARFSVRGSEIVGGMATSEWQWADGKLSDMPEDLREHLLSWATAVLFEQATAKVAL